MTVVLDASTLVALLAPTPSMTSVVRELAEDPDWNGPEHLRLEAASALRGLLLGGKLTHDGFDRSLQALARAEVRVHATGPLLPRIGELAANATPYDAAYVALAERLDSTILTLDAKLARVPGIRCEVRVVAAG